MPHATLYSTSIYISDEEINRLLALSRQPKLSRRFRLSNLVHRAADLVRENGVPTLHAKRKVTSISCTPEDYQVLSRAARGAHSSLADILLAAMEV